MAPVSGKRTLLIADDDKDLLSVLNRYLTGKGFEVHGVEDGMQAVQQAIRLKPSLIILDYNMPAASGAVVYERLRDNAFTNLTPVLFLTANMPDLVRTGLTQIQSVRFLRKPVELKLLHGTILEMLGDREAASGEEAVQPPAAPPAAPAGEGRPKIMVVDDEDSARTMLRQMLELAGYRVVAAAGGNEALAALDEATDLILLDVCLAGKSGLQLCRELRARLGKRFVPIIILTAKGGTENLVQSLESGADDFLVKPCKVQELLARVRSQLRLKDAIGRLRAANAFKDELLAIASHDLIQPLSSISGFAELLVNKHSEIDDKKRRQYLGTIQKCSRSMSEIVLRFLHKARLEGGTLQLDIQEIGPAELCAACIERVSVLAMHKGIQVVQENRLPEGYRLRADPRLLEEIAANLLGNAVKFTPAGGEVRLRLDSSAGYFSLSVKDTGPGIAPEEQKAVFEKFRKGSAREAEGAGYGLAIVLQFTELHGGSVSLDSSPGKGSEFVVLLPETGTAGESK